PGGNMTASKLCRVALLALLLGLFSISSLLPTTYAAPSSSCVLTWTEVSMPTGVHDYLNGIAAGSSTDIWAVGSSAGTTLTDHWNGTAWSIVSSPSVASATNRLNAVTVISPTDAWAVGVSGTDDGSSVKTLTLHWNGTSWSIVNSPNSTDNIN